MAITEDNKSRIESLIYEILKEIGENPNRDGLIQTPKRIADMYTEIFKGYDENNFPKITVFENDKDNVKYDQMIFDKGYFYSMCEHHMIPFFGEYYFAYIPNKKIIGISKIARIVDFYSARLQIQERLVKQIVDKFEELVEPLGVALVMKGRHLCKEMRGVRKYNSYIITSEVRGVFKENTKTKEEFLSLIKND